MMANYMNLHYVLTMNEVELHNSDEFTLPWLPCFYSTNNFKVQTGGIDKLE